MNHVLAAFLLGLAGSLHCVGMCSPLVIAVSGPAFWRKLVYNVGRISVYVAYGGMVAAVGNAFPWTKHQQWLTLGVGLVMVIAGITGFTRINIPLVTGFFVSLTERLKGIFGRLVPHRNGPALFLLGAVNGMLPCGLTYLALTYCVVLPTAGEGMLFMAIFGTGTLAVMLGFTSIVTVAIQRWKWNLSRITTVILLLTGSWMIGRAMMRMSPATTPPGIVKIDAVCH